jgi:D-3-phosphoglycerate dehydrogenase
MMGSDVDIFVTLSTFAEYSDEPLHLLQQSEFSFLVNPHGRRIKPEEVVEMGRACRGLVAGVEPYSAETLAALPRLQCISRCGSGIDSIDLAEARRRNIAVLNTPDEPIIAVAELTLTMILALLRQLPNVNTLTHERQWQRVPGNLLWGKILGIIGLGRIGQRVVELVEPFGVKVIAVEPRPDAGWLKDREVELVDLPQLLARADIVSIHAARSSENQLFLGAPEFAQMKPGAWLVNMARGDMLDEAALNTALDDGHLSGAGLDVFPQEPYTGPLCDNPRAIMSPHQATLTIETRVAMETKAVANLIKFLHDHT